METTRWKTGIAAALVLLGGVQTWFGLAGDTPLYAALGVTDAALGCLLYWAEVHRTTA